MKSEKYAIYNYMEIPLFSVKKHTTLPLKPHKK